jgi:hypothetical protein
METSANINTINPISTINNNTNNTINTINTNNTASTYKLQTKPKVKLLERKLKKIQEKA